LYHSDVNLGESGNLWTLF